MFYAASFFRRLVGAVVGSSFGFALAFFPMVASAAATAQGPRPNVLFLFADDQRADTIAAWGNPHIQTPHLDKLVATGFSFRANYIFGGDAGAVCRPSRAMLMSGKNWFRIDTRKLTGERLLPEVLGENGYVTFATGKWHNGKPSWRRAFQRGKDIMFGGMSNHLRVPVQDLGVDGQLTPERVSEKFSSELFADAVIDFLKQYDGRQPFFAYVAFTAPHDPRMAPPAQVAPYYARKPPLPPNFLPQHPFDNGHMLNCRDENLAPWPRPEAVVRDQLAEYYAMITHLDEQIGRILATLNQTGQATNTIIIYSADNGLALGSHGLMGKQNVYEHSMRVPLIFTGPGIPAGQSTTAFTYLLDVFPTVCDLTGVPAPAGLEGESLRLLWEGRKTKIRDTIFLPYMTIQRAVRDERWKLIAYPEISHLQLFDLQADPDERRNLIAAPEHRGEVRRLLALMKDWQTRSGDTLEVPTASKPYPPIDLTGRPRKYDPFQPDWVIKKYFE